MRLPSCWPTRRSPPRCRAPIAFRARSHVNDIMALSRRDVLAFEGARRAWAGAFEQSGLSLDDLSLVEDA